MDIKKNLKILLILSIFAFFFGLYLTFSSSNLSKKIVEIFPTNLKNVMKDSVFYVPIKLREYKASIDKISDLQQKIKKLNLEIDALKSKINSGQTSDEILISTNSKKFKLKKIFIDHSLPIDSKKMHKKNGYLEIYGNNILAIFWTGKIVYFDKTQISKNNITFNIMKTNINSFLKNDEKNKFISIKDALILDDKLYLSYTKNIKPETNCLNLSIIAAKINNNDKKLILNEFERFFTYDECQEARFNGYQSGGRIVKYKDNKILLTIGDFQNFTPAQDKNSFFGKIIAINIKDKSHQIISMGHRNQQGLYYDKERDLIISTEHGQKGGDEVNNIIFNKDSISNYGWPIASYSTYYGYENKEIKKIAPFKKSHKENGFIEPMIYFTPALGISQIIPDINIDKTIENKFLVTSMRQQKIVFVNLNYENNSATVIDELKINERIRDIIKFENNNYLLFLENSPAIGILSEK
tara:strand:+ start:708 stop:2111 length:1404 start_codon:yes stop_codon:yes gene_type:complete